MSVLLFFTNRERELKAWLLFNEVQWLVSSETGFFSFGETSLVLPETLLLYLFIFLVMLVSCRIVHSRSRPAYSYVDILFFFQGVRIELHSDRQNIVVFDDSSFIYFIFSKVSFGNKVRFIVIHFLFFFFFIFFLLFSLWWWEIVWRVSTDDTHFLLFLVERATCCVPTFSPITFPRKRWRLLCGRRTKGARELNVLLFSYFSRFMDIF